MNSSEMREKLLNRDLGHLSPDMQEVFKETLSKMSDDEIRAFYNRVQKVLFQVRKALGEVSEDPDYGF